MLSDRPHRIWILTQRFQTSNHVSLTNFLWNLYTWHSLHQTLVAVQLCHAKDKNRWVQIQDHMYEFTVISTSQTKDRTRSSLYRIKFQKNSIACTAATLYSPDSMTLINIRRWCEDLPDFDATQLNAHNLIHIEAYRFSVIMSDLSETR